MSARRAIYNSYLRRDHRKHFSQKNCKLFLVRYNTVRYRTIESKILYGTGTYSPDVQVQCELETTKLGMYVS